MKPNYIVLGDDAANAESIGYISASGNQPYLGSIYASGIDHATQILDSHDSTQTDVFVLQESNANGANDESDADSEHLLILGGSDSDSDGGPGDERTSNAALKGLHRDRRKKKGDFRRLWIQRINAAARTNGLTYSRFIHGLKQADIEINRKVLAQIALDDPKGFSDLVALARG